MADIEPQDQTKEEVQEARPAAEEEGNEEVGSIAQNMNTWRNGTFEKKKKPSDKWLAH